MIPRTDLYIYTHTHTKDTRSNLDSRRPGKKLVPLPPPLALVGPLDKLLRGDKGGGGSVFEGRRNTEDFIMGTLVFGK